MEQTCPSSSQIKDEAASKAKTRHFPVNDFGGRGGLNFPFNLSKIVVSSLGQLPDNKLKTCVCVCFPKLQYK